MISEDKLKRMIEDVLTSMNTSGAPLSKESVKPSVSSDDLADLTEIDLKKQLLVPNAANEGAYLKLKQTTPARIGIWRSGPRYLTESQLRFRADHAVAMDAVFNNVSESFLKEWGLVEIKTPCEDKDEFLTRPDLGRKIEGENADILKRNCPSNAKVQIFVADGLSSTAIETNAKDCYQAIVQGLKRHGIDAGTPFFLRYGRVPSMDAVGEILTPEVTVILIGERPGLATGESMSCYMAYKASTTMPEANRTVISNIHKGGTPAVEAGAHIADIIKTILEQKASGVELKL
ncbi:MAG: ethanolamine ammonia-lyase subunit EutC [Desulfobulbaceae bacterium]|nr:ethanolamine ammonia-lyase subunit EutC [Desulfobulbaceae bacterium]